MPSADYRRSTLTCCATRSAARADKGRDLREIQDFLDHCSINNTVIYTKLRPGRFERIWD